MPQEFYRIRRLPPYVFAEVNAMKAAARARGEDVIDLGMGNPDAAPPAHVIDKLTETLKNPRVHGYSSSRGVPGLRKAYAAYYARRFNVTLDPDTEVIVTLGSKEGFANFAQAITAPGDTVLVPNPCYPIHSFGFILAGASIRNIAVGPNADFMEGLKRAVRGSVPPPTALVVNYPANPTAETVTLDFYRELVEFARRHDIIVLSDVAYAEVYFDDDPPPSILQVPGAKEVAIEFSSLSKTYSMAGWRIGFAVGSKRLIAALARVKSYLDYGAFTPIQVAATAALNGPQDCIDEMRKRYRQRRDVLIEGLAQAGWTGAVAEGLDVRLGEDPRALRQSRQRGILEAAAGRRQGGGGAGPRLRRVRRRVCAHRAGGEPRAAAAGGAQHQAVHGEERGGLNPPMLRTRRR